MSDYIERLMGRARDGDFFGDLPDARRKAPPARSEKHSVRRDSFDKSAWSQITDQVPALGEQVAEAQERHDERGAVAYEDLFNLLSKGDPRFEAPERMQADYIPQHMMFSRMFEAPDFKWVRNETAYDNHNTALAMLSMKRQMDDVMEQVEEAVEQIEQAQQELDDALAAAQAFLDAGGQPGEGEPGEGGIPVQITGGMDSESEQEIIDRLEQALNGMGDAAKQGEAVAEEAGAKLKQGASEAKDAIEAEQQAASGYGIEPGELKRMDYEERRRLSERLDKSRLGKFAARLGGWRMSWDAERRRKVQHAPGEVVDVELGNDLTRMLPSEVVNLAIPELEDLFWLRHAKRELMQQVTRGAARAGKGPIIVVCDESSSMTARLGADGTTREMWSKAVCLGLVDQAKRDSRDFIYIGFASPGQQWVTTFENGRYDHDKVIDFAEHFFSGGTHYETPLTMAMEIIGKYAKSRKAKPDVVFITDAECDVGQDFIDAWREVRERADVRCYGIQIGGSGRHTAMDDLVDRLIEISQLNANPDSVTELFRTI